MSATTAAPSKITKAALIADLVTKGHHRPALTRMTLAALTALASETPAPAAAQPTAPKPSADPAQTASVRLSSAQRKTVLAHNPKWIHADRQVVEALLADVTDVKPSTDGKTLRLVAGTKTVAWINANRIDFPGAQANTSLSTGRARK